MEILTQKRVRTKQQEAVARDRSVWVDASAGTGKTRVLVGRVLNLLLGGTLPERILCLTFTRAAAAEMANRIFGELRGWVTLEDEALEKALQDWTGERPDEALLRQARRLFAFVLDRPGGLAIATIHGFCQSLLGRFPLEARLSPNFQLLDERTSAELLGEAIRRTLLRARQDPALEADLGGITRHVSEDGFAALITDLARERGRLERVRQHHGDRGMGTAIHRALGVAEGLMPADLIAEASQEGAFDGPALRAVLGVLERGSPNQDRATWERLEPWLAAAPQARPALFANYEAAFFTQAGEPRADISLLTKKAAEATPEALAALKAEQRRLMILEERVAAIVVATATSALTRFTVAVLEQYGRAKRQRGALDFEDLILGTRALLERPDTAPWVLYKLDGGIDHILIDEAQDTNPDQWQVVKKLAEEFFAGQGASPVRRTIFAVGDPKQSIYSFQRADPAEFERMRGHFGRRVAAAEDRLEAVELATSFRSTRAVLALVDAVFASPAAREGVVASGHVLTHGVHRAREHGLVELWPPVEPDDAEEPEPWALPRPGRDAVPPQVRLAHLIAKTIRYWLASGARLQSEHRPIRPGDVMILLRQRGEFLAPLVQALKEAGVPVAGADRMVLTEQLAVMDLMALGRFLLLPEDDLTLAVVLKGPLYGLCEKRLFDLAYGRGGASLWSRLRDAASGGPADADAGIVERAFLELAELLGRVDFVAPHELYADLLGRRGGRRRILSRLGYESVEAIDEFMAASLRFEREHAPSLQGFLGWLDAGTEELKRDLEQGGRDEVRVITVHGAKGLEAPIVFLPDTMQCPTTTPSIFWPSSGRSALAEAQDAGEEGDELPLWVPSEGRGEPVCGHARTRFCDRRDEEYRRLLYVALTRARDRLYVAGWQGSRATPDGSWYNLIEAGFERLGAAAAYPYGCLPAEWHGRIRRFESGLALAEPPAPAASPLPPEPVIVPGWALAPPPAEPTPPRPLTPSRPAHPEPAGRSPLDPSPLAQSGPDPYRRGLLVHRLLQVLPSIAPSEWEARTRRFLASPAHGLTEPEQKGLAAETLAVLTHPVFGRIFGPDSRAEVPVVGRVAGRGGAQVLSGRIDRLVVTQDRVLIVDFKTNRPPPETAEGVPESYRRQLASYTGIMGEIYPGREVEAAILWTDGPRLMPIPRSLLEILA